MGYYIHKRKAYTKQYSREAEVAAPIQVRE
jgi:hypothetical protein